GPFRHAPPGSVAVSDRIILFGANRGVNRAQPSALIAQAAPLRTHPMWAVVRGDATLPLAGNAANLDRVLHETQSLTVAVDWDVGFRAELTGYCARPESAEHLAENLRAMVTLAAIASHRAEVKAFADSVQISVEGTTVRVQLSASPSALDQLGVFGASGR